jgi:hypothetical protein
MPCSQVQDVFVAMCIVEIVVVLALLTARLLSSQDNRSIPEVNHSMITCDKEKHDAPDELVPRTRDDRRLCWTRTAFLVFIVAHLLLDVLAIVS